MPQILISVPQQEIRILNSRRRSSVKCWPHNSYVPDLPYSTQFFFLICHTAMFQTSFSSILAKTDIQFDLSKANMFVRNVCFSRYVKLYYADQALRFNVQLYVQQVLRFRFFVQIFKPKIYKFIRWGHNLEGGNQCQPR